MRETERLASAFIGRRLEALRLKRSITAKDMGVRIGLTPTNYRHRELGLKPISLEFLLRCHLVLNPDTIERLWFPVSQGLAAVDDIIIRVQIGLWERAAMPVTLEQIIEACADAFGVPVGAITGGLHHAKVRQARTACAIVVASRPHLRLSELALLVGRSRRTLWHIRKQAQEADELLLQRVEEIQREVDAL